MLWQVSHAVCAVYHAVVHPITSMLLDARQHDTQHRLHGTLAITWVQTMQQLYQHACY